LLLASNQQVHLWANYLLSLWWCSACHSFHLQTCKNEHA
jgi:hypothetical protein